MLSVNPRRSKTDRYEEFNRAREAKGRRVDRVTSVGHADSMWHAVRASGTSTGRQLRVKND